MIEPKLSDTRLMFAFAHDIRGYLRTILTRVQMVQLGGGAQLPEPDRACLEEAAVAAGDMNRLLNAMVSYYDVAPTDETMGLRLILRGVLMDCKAMISEAGASVSVVNDLNVVVSRALQPVLRELLTNACRFRRPGEKTVIEIQTSQPDSQLIELIVSDNGSGVDPACIEKIFIPFQRMHSRGEFPGFGLGLAFCDRVLSVNGGTITAAVSASGGLALKVTLPVVASR
jgi:light-regulated signal transduction histidine kinase (bacteriophytochrome)